MAINDVSLTAGMRSNLVSLQSTVDLLNRTQTRLSTGKKVNSALDNPLNFFTAQALTSRASDLAGFKDGMSEAVQTVKAANSGITAISSLIAQAKAIAASAKATTAAPTDNTETLTVGTLLNGDTITVGGYTFTAVATAGSAGTTQFEIGATTDATATNLAAAISARAAVSAGSLSDVNVLGSVSGSVITLQSSVTALATSTVTRPFNRESITIASVAALTTGQTVVIGGFTFTAVATAGSAGTTQFEIGATTAATATNLGAAISAQATLSAASMNNINLVGGIGVNGSVITVQSSTTDIVAATITTTASATVVVEGTPTTVDASGSESAFSTTAVAGSDRENYYTQYTDILTQIDNLANDSGYKGVNLLQTGNTLDVSFGTGTTDKLTISGFDATYTGLAMSQTSRWGANTSVTADVTSMDTALNTLKSQSASLASNLSVINVRQDWVKEMVNVLTQGADNLTLADMNEEGANMLMLNTRNSLGTTALSLSSQAAQSVLRLF